MAKAPLPVKVENEEPLQVEVARPDPVKLPDGNVTLPPTTTKEQDLVTAGQRGTSMFWEVVQATIAVSVTWSVIYCAITETQSETLVNAFFFIVATYFTRTNHTRVGGVGQKQDGVYLGR